MTDVFEISSNLGHIFRVCSECARSVLRVCSECAQSVLRVCSDCVQSVFRVCSECVQYEVISSTSASSVSIFGIFFSDLVPNANFGFWIPDLCVGGSMCENVSW